MKDINKHFKKPHALTTNYIKVARYRIFQPSDAWVNWNIFKSHLEVHDERDRCTSPLATCLMKGKQSLSISNRWLPSLCLMTSQEGETTTPLDN